MPIRINLLAEQQAAEEARRRDPVKRAIWAASAITALMILWAVSLQAKLGSLAKELSTAETRLQTVDNNSKEAKDNFRRRDDIEKTLASLESYSTNRFYWAEVLDALQRVNVSDVRITRINSRQAYSTNAEHRLVTNIVMRFTPPAAWKFWARKPQYPNILASVTNQISVITNRVEYRTNKVPAVVKYTITTNRNNLTASVDIRRPAIAVEEVVLNISARDYGPSPGRQADAFFEAIAKMPHFKDHLHKTEGKGMRLKERDLKPDLDPLDPVHPNKPFISFTIECRYEERAFTND